MDRIGVRFLLKGFTAEGSTWELDPAPSGASQARRAPPSERVRALEKRLQQTCGPKAEPQLPTEVRAVKNPVP
jgi:hypothetical protein